MKGIGAAFFKKRTSRNAVIEKKFSIELNSRLDTTKEGISKLEDKAEEGIQNALHRAKKQNMNG